MGIRLRLLTAEIALLTAVASLFATNTEKWTKVYERRLYAEMALNLWRSGNEQKAVEEIPTGSDPISTGLERVEEAPLVLVGEVVSGQTASQEAPIQQPSAETQAVEAVPASSPAEAAAVYTSSAPLYLVEGEQLDPGVAEYLYQKLCAAGIGWFYEYALCLAYQESSFNPLAENPNGRDKGLFQYRAEFHPDLDWRNPYQQVDIFTAQMAARANAGCDVYTMISRHMMSDYGPYNQQYVDLVLSHLPKLQGVWN